MTPIETVAAVVLGGLLAAYLSWCAYGAWELWNMDADDERWDAIAEMWRDAEYRNRYP